MRLTTRRSGDIAPVREKGCLKFLYIGENLFYIDSFSRDPFYGWQGGCGCTWPTSRPSESIPFGSRRPKERVRIPVSWDRGRPAVDSLVSSGARPAALRKGIPREESLGPSVPGWRSRTPLPVRDRPKGERPNH